MTQDEVYQKLRTLLANSLAIDEEMVTPDARIINDLGAESIDFLDIAFQAEKVFGIRIKPNDMLLGDSPSEEYVLDGQITDAGLVELRRRMPHVCFDELEQNRDIRNVQSVLTVDSLVQFIHPQVKELPPGCTRAAAENVLPENAVSTP